MCLLFTFIAAGGFAQTETMPAGSFIINMGVVPQTINNAIRPYGLIWDIIKNNKAQVRWIISPTKVKDGADFTYNGVDYKGGSFIIPQKYISAAVLAKINAVWPSVISGVFTTTPLTVNVSYNLKYTPKWTFDFQNGSIAQAYLTNAGIPIADYPKKLPQDLNGCDDLFVMPHADPTWATHKNLLAWNLSNQGWIWAGCHAVSAMENLYNPADSTQEMDFLSQHFDGYGQDRNTTAPYAGNSLVLWTQHSDPGNTFTYQYHNDAEMQFMGGVEGGVGASGAEQCFMPYNATSGGAPGRVASWRPSTKLAVTDQAPDATNPNVPENSNGLVAEVLYGRAFGNSARGEVLYEAGHSFNGNTPADVAGQRIFFNFSFLAINDKDPIAVATGPSSINAGSTGNFSVSVIKPGSNISDYFINWTSSCGGTFSSPHGVNTTFIPLGGSGCGPCQIMVTVTDGCGREFYGTVDLTVTVCPVPPVALDRTANMISNPPGTGPKSIGATTQLDGTDIDGTVVSYTVTTLPPASAGVLYYDNDGNSTTADIALPVNVALTGTQAASIKFDPAEGYSGNATFNYTVTDNMGLIDATPAVYTIPVNPPPVAADILTTPVSTNAGEITIAPALNATDDGTIISYTIIALPTASQGVLKLNGVPVAVNQIITPAQAAQLTFLASGSFTGYPTFTYTATDDKVGVDPTPATVTIQLVNQPPVAQDISTPWFGNSTGTGQTAISGLSATDADGTIASYTIMSLPAVTQGVLYYKSGTVYNEVTCGQVLTPTEASNLKFDPADGYTGVATFQFTATDNLGLADNTPATYYLPVNKATPLATDISNHSIYSGSGQTAINALAGQDRDATHIIVSYPIISIPSASKGILYYTHNGNVISVTTSTVVTAAEKGTLQFDPADGATGNAVFTFSVIDDEGMTDQTPATFTIPLTNQLPVAKNVNNPSIGGTTNLSALDALDGDGTIASYTIISLPDSSAGILKFNNSLVYLGQSIPATLAGALQFTPKGGFTGSAVFTFTATDDQGATDLTPANFTIPVTSSNPAPVADLKTTTSIAINQGATVILPLSGTDDGTIVSYTIKNLPPASTGVVGLYGIAVSNNQVIPANNADKLTFTPSGTFSGTATFKYSATDDLGQTGALVLYNIPVTNQVPVAQNISMPQLKKSLTSSIYPLRASDADGTIASYQIITLPTLATLYVDLTGTASYTLVVVNQILTPAAAGRLRIITGNTVGTASFTYTATDNTNLVSAAATYTIPINSNSALIPPSVPNITNTAINASATITAINSLTATDIDGTIAAYLVFNIPPPYAGKLSFMKAGTTLTDITIGGAMLTVTEATTLKFTPTGLYLGNISFTYGATDDDGMSSARGTYTIPLINTAPVVNNITNASVSSNAGPVLLSALTATDADGTVANYTITSIPTPDQGVLTLDGVPMYEGQVLTPVYVSRIKFDPDPAFNGNAKFTYTATDNLGTTDATDATFTIPVTNAAPFADEKRSQVITNYIGTAAVTIPALTGNDADGTISAYIIKTLPSGGVLYVNGVAATVNQSLNTAAAAQLSFDPSDNFAGTALFTYTVKDNSNNISVAAANYSIPVNTPPVSNNITIPAIYGSAGTTNIAALTATDDGSIQFYTITSLPDPADGYISVSGVQVNNLSQVAALTPAQVNQLQFTPGTAFKGTSFLFTATDNLGLIDVTPSNYIIPAKVSLAGRIWNDINGSVSADGNETSINGTNSGNGILTGAALYVNLINAAGTVAATTTVQTDGTYSFPLAITYTKYTLQLTTVQGTVNAAKPATTLPATWINTGENKNSTGGFADVTANGEIILNTDNTNITAQEFGIEKLPESALSSHPAGINPGLFITTTVNPSYFLTSNVGSNSNTLDYHGGTVNAIRITSFPTMTNSITINGTTYINGGTCATGTCLSWPALGVITAFTNGVGPVQPILVDPLDGAATVRIPFVAIDNAGKEDATAGYAELLYALAVVPVRLTDFTAAPSGVQVKLSWTVNAEINTDRYVVEFGSTPAAFTSIGSQKAHGISKYSLMHSTPVKGWNYYRLKMVDLDGSYTYSEIRKVFMDKKTEVQIYPNPVSEVVNISLSFSMLNKPVAVTLLDVNGRVLYQKQILNAGTTQSIDVHRLPSGSYILKLASAEEIITKPINVIR